MQLKALADPRLTQEEKHLLADVAVAIQKDLTGEALAVAKNIAATRFDFGTEDAYEALEKVNFSPALKAKILAVLNASDEMEVGQTWS